MEGTAPVAERYSLLAPLPYLAKIEKGNPQDPLLLQILPQAKEKEQVPSFCEDPLEEVEQGKHSRYLQKYFGRVLILASDRCGVHCRFCFRRHFPKENPGRHSHHGDEQQALHLLETWVRAIRTQPETEEVILSGGDPLTLSDKMLSLYIKTLSEIPHVRRVRLHTRFPIVIPNRITDQLVSLLQADENCTYYLVLHVNHPNEIDELLSRKIAFVVDQGIPILSQTVLLKGINDNIETLTALFRKLVDARVLPYYLHQLDKISGASHFNTDIEQAREIMDRILEILPGYAVPRYVQQLAGVSKKIHL